MAVRRTGWGRAASRLTGLAGRAQRAIQGAIAEEAEELRRQIVRGLNRQSPGGETLAKPDSLTLAMRRLEGERGNKALVAAGELRDAITVVVRGAEAFVGIPRGARNQEGELLARIAEVQEEGSPPIVIPMTAAMRGFLFAALREAGVEPREGSGRGVVVVRVPARPFLQPVFDEFKRGARARTAARIRRKLGWR